ncbi:MAG TPA: carboxypeptidase regulatory-like domain-containing protein [Solirubrobacteraceae bacterium]|jgi:hypothetical protein
MLRRAVAVALGLAVIGCGLLLGANMATATGTGAISGVLTNPSGAAIADATVLVYENGTIAASASTSSNGSYTAGSLVAGSYTVSFRPPPVPASGPDTGNYLPQNYSGRSPNAGADPVTVQTGVTTPDVDGVLQPGGAISGVVEDSSGNPVVGIDVGASDSDGVFAGSSATTAADGSYSIDRLPAGEYSVSFLTEGQSSYQPDYTGGSPTLAGAYGVAVTAGSTTSGVDAHLVVGGVLTGTVTDTSAAPVEDVGVSVLDSTGNDVANASTGTDGVYSVTGLATGSYRVEFLPEPEFPFSPVPNYLASYFGGSATLSGAATVEVGAGSTTSGVDGRLAAGAVIGGTVTDPADKPLDGVGVSLYGSDGTEVQLATTGSDGTYQIAGLPSGSYKIDFDTEGGFTTLNDVGEFYGGSSLASATAIHLTSGDPPAVINAQLAAGATISGTVTDSLGDPLSGVPVEAFDVDGNVVTGATTAHFNGDYEIEGLPQGTYRIGFDQGLGCCSLAGNYSPQFSGDKSTLAAAETVTVGPAGSASGVDAALTPGGRISGRVTDAGGSTLGDINVEAIDAAGNVVAATQTFPDGTYWLSGLGSGSYRIQYAGAFALVGPVVNTEYFGGSATLAGAAGVSVVAGATTAGVDMELSRTAGGIAGVVTNGTDGSLAGASVTVYELSGSTAVATSVTAADGSFALAGLGPGFYRVGFALTGYASAYYSGATSLSAAQPIYVASGASATGIDAALPTSGASSPPAPRAPAPQAYAQPSPGPTPSQGSAGSQPPGGSVVEFVVLPSVRKLKLSSRGFKIPVQCLEKAPCTGEVTLSVTHRKARVKLASASVKIAPGGEHYAIVKLNAYGAKLFRSARHRLRVTVTVSVLGPGTATQTVRETVLIV